MNVDRIYRILVAAWVGLSCPWAAQMAVSYIYLFAVKGLGATPYAYGVFEHRDSQMPLTVAAEILGGIFLGYGVYQGQLNAIKIARILLSIGMGYDLLWIVIWLFQFIEHYYPITSFHLLYLSKFVALLITNYLVFKHLVRSTAHPTAAT